MVAEEQEGRDRAGGDHNNDREQEHRGGGLAECGCSIVHTKSVPATVTAMDESTLHFQGHASVADELEARILTIRDSL